MAKLAVDVALLLPQAIEEQAVILNAGLGGFKLSKEGCRPHITLAMAYIEEDDIPAIGKMLHDIAETHHALDLKNMKPRSTPFGQGATVTLDIEKTWQLQALHEEAVRLLKQFRKDGAQASWADAEHEPPSTASQEWVEHFAEQNAYEHYRPHITLGVGTTDADVHEEKFTATRLALCHLGNYCTCKKILFETTLTKE